MDFAFPFYSEYTTGLYLKPNKDTRVREKILLVGHTISINGRHCCIVEQNKAPYSSFVEIEFS